MCRRLRIKFGDQGPEVNKAPFRNLQLDNGHLTQWMDLADFASVTRSHARKFGPGVGDEERVFELRSITRCELLVVGILRVGLDTAEFGCLLSGFRKPTQPSGKLFQSRTVDVVLTSLRLRIQGSSQPSGVILLIIVGLKPAAAAGASSPLPPPPLSSASFLPA
jgi:hypothetical protein